MPENMGKVGSMGSMSTFRCLRLSRDGSPERHVRHGRRAWGVMMAAVSLVCLRADFARASPGTEEAREAARAYVDDFLADLEHRTAAEFDEKLIKRVQAEDWDSHVVFKTLKVLKGADDLTLLQAVTQMLRQSDEPLSQALTKAAAEIGDKEKEIVDKWKEVRGQYNAKRIELYELAAEQKVAGQIAFLMSVDNRWFWLFGLIAMAVLAALVLHDRRHEIRRWLNGGKARAMGLATVLQVVVVLFVVVTLAIFLCGNRIYQALLEVGTGTEASPIRQVQAENEEMAKKRAALADARTAPRAIEKARELLAERLPEQAKTNPETLQSWNELVQLWGTALSQLRTLAVAGAVRTSLVDKGVQAELLDRLDADRKNLDDVQKEVDAKAALTVSYYRRREWIRRGLGVVLFGLVVAGGIVFDRKVQGRKKKMRSTCPMCLGEGTFEKHVNGDAQAAGMVRCTNLIAEQPYEQCDFELLARYLEMRKLAFPTLGVPAAGKTRWLAATYRQLSRNEYPRTVQFQKVKSTVAAEYDRIVDEIYEKRLPTAATRTDRIPRPLVFNFRDYDRLGRSNILVNIFDYSGEVTYRETLEDRQRRRALEGDGFFFFLDPTSPSHFQAQALQNFSEDLCTIKKVDTGRQLHIPVALCISKIDLMVNQPYAGPSGDGPVGEFYRELGEIGWLLDLESIARRSQLVASLRETIWPGWDIEQSVRDLFGGRHMFFPVTPVGLNGVGIEDLSARVFEPLGLLEPLLWLLHMSGYPVFSEGRLKLL
jgi:hypothetical protein